MVSERNRVLKLVEYLQSIGISINIAKNKARGNKGFFSVKSNNYRIDIAKGLDSAEVLSILTHEFAHYVHYNYDKTLSSLDFLFDNLNNELLEELISVTVDSVPKDYAKQLFEKKTNIKEECRILASELKELYPNFNANQHLKEVESKIKLKPLKYLLKYDSVKLLEGFFFKVYSIKNLDVDFKNIDKDIKLYLNLKSKQRALRRISSKISRLNKYYNSPTELFARAFEMYALNKNALENKTPNLYLSFEKLINSNNIPQLTNFIEILKEN